MSEQRHRSAPTAIPVERVRTEHPPDESWRADALAGSRHSRLLDEIRMPAEDHDAERARVLCAEIARNALRDFAPAMMLVPAPLRARCQTLAAFARTLFDFALQTGLEGERLSQINRWEFDLELALEGEPPGQPVFVAMAREEARAPWPRGGLDAIVEAARARVTAPPRDHAEAAAAAERLASALVLALTGEPASASRARLGGALLRTRSLQDLAEALRRGAVLLPGLSGSAAPGTGLDAAVRAEVGALRSALKASRAGSPTPGEPAAFARPLRYLAAAAEALLGVIERSPAPCAARLGAGRRILLLLRARLRAPGA